MARLALVCALTGALLSAARARAADPGAEAAAAYALDTSASTQNVQKGETGKLVVVIRPKSPSWHVHPQAPLKIRFEGPPSLRIEKGVLARRDAVDPTAAEPRFETTFVAIGSGPQEAKAVVDFFICSDAACVKQLRTVPITVSVR